MKNIIIKRNRNFSLKSKIKTLKKKTFKNLSNLNFNKFKFYYKLFSKNINIISNKKILKKNKSSRLNSRFISWVKKNYFFNLLRNNI